MTDNRKRSPAGTMQRRVFVLLRDRASMPAEQLATILGHEREACRKACWYLIQRGLVVRRRLRAGCVLYSVVRGKHAPEDRRGKPAACRNHRGARAYANWTRMMADKNGANWRPPFRATVALDSAWPSPLARYDHRGA